MTPAVDLLKKQNIKHALHSYTHDPHSESWGLEAAEKLGLPAARVFKTLLLVLDGKQHAVALVPSDRQLNLKLAAKAFGVKKQPWRTRPVSPNIPVISLVQ